MVRLGFPIGNDGPKVLLVAQCELRCQYFDHTLLEANDQVIKTIESSNHRIVESSSHRTGLTSDFHSTGAGKGIPKGETRPNLVLALVFSLAISRPTLPAATLSLEAVASAMDSSRRDAASTRIGSPDAVNGGKNGVRDRVRVVDELTTWRSEGWDRSMSRADADADAETERERERGGDGEGAKDWDRPVAERAGLGESDTIDITSIWTP